LAVPNNWSRLEQASGLGGFDYYAVPPIKFSELVDIAMAINYSMAVSKIPWAPEIMAGIWKLPGVQGCCSHLQAKDLEFLYFSSIALGLKGMNFYMMVNRENWQNAPISEEGRFTPTVVAPVKVAKFMQRVPVFASMQKVQTLAVMYYRPYAWEAYMTSDRHVSVGGYILGQTYRNFKRLYAALMKLNCDPGIIDLWTNPEHITRFQLVFVPCSVYMDSNAQQLLMDYVASGGNVVFCPAPPRLDLDLNPNSLFSVYAWRDQNGHTDSSPRQYKIGKGKIMELDMTAVSDDSKQTKLELEMLRTVLMQFNVMSEVQINEPNVMAVLHRNGTNKVLFLINIGIHTVRAHARFRRIQSGKLVEVLSGEATSTIMDGRASIPLPGKSVRSFFVHES